jgi:preprotein translocase subunit SecF
MGAAKMRPQKKGRSLTRTVFTVAVVAVAIVVSLLAFRGVALADISWTLGIDR